MDPSTDALPMTASLASDASQPVEIFDSNAALHMAVVDRVLMASLGDDWDSSGVYVLLDPPDPDGNYGAYVGKASGLRSRMKGHVRGKENWVRAILIARDTTHGWHSAQVGWLEGHLHDTLEGATMASLSNLNRPQDESLPTYERASLASAVDPILAVMRMIGYSPDTADEETDNTVASSTPRRHYSMSIKKLIDSGYLEAGEGVSSTKPAWPGSGKIAPNGNVQADGRMFTSPSGAGSHVRGGKATNGWAFWAVDRNGASVPLATIRARYLKQQDSDQQAKDI